MLNPSASISEFLGDQLIPYTSWHVNLAYLTMALSACILLAALRNVHIGAMSRAKESYVFSQGFNASLFLMQVIVLGVFLLAFSLSRLTFAIPTDERNLWAEYSSRVSWLSLSLNVALAGAAIFRLRRGMDIKLKENLSLSDFRSGALRGLFFDIALVLIPFLECYLLGGSFVGYIRLIGITIASGLLFFFLGLVVKSALVSRFFLALSFVALTNIILYPICYQVVLRYEVPKAQSYCEQVIKRVEQMKAKTGVYPEELSWREIIQGNAPYLIRKGADYLYSGHKERYELTLFGGLYDRYVYSSETGKWAVYWFIVIY